MKRHFLTTVPHAFAIFFLCFLVFFQGCKKQGPLQQINPAFREYVQAVTCGIISTRSVIKIRLTEESSSPGSLDMPVTEKYFKFKPAIQGKTYWTDNRTLEFRPDEKLPPDQIYTVEFYLSKIITVPDSLKTMVFQFQTMSQIVDVTVDNHKAYSHRDLSREFLSGTLKTSDDADDLQVEKILKAKQQGQALPIVWTHDSKTRTHHFQVDSLRRGSAAGTVRIEWDGSPISSKSSGNKDVEIPALGDFKILHVQSFPDEELGILVQFSDPLQPDQNLDGLFRVGKRTDLRYAVDDNQLRIYLPDQEDKKVKLILEPSIRNINKVELGKRITEDVMIENTKPNVRFVGDGSILPSSNGMLLPFEAVNLNAVDIKVIQIYEKNILQFLQINDLNGNSELARVGRVVLKRTMPLKGVTDYGKWNRYSIDLSALMKTEPGAIYSIILNFKKAYSVYPCNQTDLSENLNGSMMTLEDPEKENEKDWGYYSNYYDDDYANGGWRNYKWEERDDPCRSSYFFNKTISRNIFASDLGLIAKTGDDGVYRVFVTDIITTRPLSGATVEFFNFQLQSLGKATTDADGTAIVPLKNKPFVLQVKSGKQTGYLKLADGASLSLSMFDVSGQPVQKGIKGMIYGDRGVWRPGDSLFLTFILEDKMHQLPPRHPVSFSLISPAGQLMNRMVQTSASNGFYTFRTATSPESPTGNWLAKVNVGGVEFQKMLKIETVKPNRLKIKFDFRTEFLVKDKIPPAILEASWLTGSKAGKLKAKVTLTLTKSVTAFKKYPGFVFDNPTAGFSAENITVFDGRLDAEGRTLIAPKIHVTHVAPGALKASFETMVFETGGDFSIDRFSIPFYPYSSYVGIRTPNMSPGERVLNTDKSYNIELLNVDANGSLIPSNRLKVEVYQLDWRWWWDNSESGSADFISTNYLRPVDTADVKTQNGKATYPFEVASDKWGRYLIKVTDKKSGHAAGKVVYVDWPGYYRMPGGEKQAASMLTMTTNKTTYRVGEKVTLTLPSSPDGRALVTLENGTGILQSFWMLTKKGSTDIVFEATSAMTPNCYAYVTLIQPHAQTKNDLPIRLYGVLPIFVENPNSRLKPIITLPKELIPGKSVAIRVKELNGKPMTYTLAVVDEGLLDLTRFKTPDPWTIFNAREALGVKTWDLFDQVIGAYSGELQRILSIGGDQEAEIKGSLKANRFKPMVRFFGPFDLKKGEIQTHTFTMPQYIGSVRVMVVAGKDGAYGNDEKTAVVKKPLMVLATLPRVLGPGESVKLPISIFAMDRTIRNVKIDLFINDLFNLTGEQTKQISFREPGDQQVTFDLSVLKAVGIGKIRIVATSGKEKAEHEIEIQIRNPNSRQTNVTEKVIQPGGTWTTSYIPVGVPGTNKGTLALSSFPSLNLEKRLDYLIQYPYGCIEQTTSAAFPQLYLFNLLELSPESKNKIESNIRYAIQRMKSFQLANGGLAYWPGSSYADDWGTCYAGHFMLEAEQKGYSLPVSFLSAWKEFQRQKAISWSYNANYINDDLMQAYRLFTLALARAPELGAMNKLLEKKDLSVAARWRLAAAYQLAGKNEVAMQLVATAKTNVKPYREQYFTYGSDLRDKAMIVEALCMLNMKTKAAPLVKEITTLLNNNSWYSTQSTAFALLALTKYMGNSGGSGIKATFRLNTGPEEEIKSKLSLITKEIETIAGKKGVLRIANKGKNILYAQMTLIGVPAIGDTTSAANNLKLNVVYKSMTGGLIRPDRLEQGMTFIAEVTVTNPGLRGAYSNLTLLQVFPSGWEVINARNSDIAQSKTAFSSFNYQDVRDDRVVTSFDLPSSQTKTFRVMLMATYLGKFYLPSTFCEAMYDNTISARVPGRWVEVVPGSK
ncbi:MAG: MG2 domain-containing protein [Bacteroidales bacterium]|nr:MG2 domain-containing protein [Bacteroidales bacterium]